MPSIVTVAEISENYIDEGCFITEILNVESSPNVSVAKARVLPGTITELHSLMDTQEIYYILSGTGEMEIDGVVAGYVNQGDLVRIFKNISQRIKNTGSEDLIFLCICTPRFDQLNYKSIVNP